MDIFVEKGSGFAIYHKRFQFEHEDKAGLMYSQMELRPRPSPITVANSISYPEPSSSWPRNEGLWHNPLSSPQIVEIWCFCACAKLFNIEDMEHMNKFLDSINNALLRLGKVEISLKEAQFEVLKAIVMERKDSLVILPTGCVKSLIYQTS